MATRSRTYPQTHSELVGHLAAQVGHLERSAIAFDAGTEDEASRLATSIRVLVHDHPRSGSQSVLTQLGIKDSLRYLDTSLSHRGLRPNHPGWDAGLASMEILPGRGGRYVAMLDNLPPERVRQSSFSSWWSKTIYRRVGFGRKDLVLGLADMDGGAHVDARLEDAYADLTRRNVLGWAYSDDNGNRPFEGNAAKASVRQITYELLSTLKGQLSPEGDLLSTEPTGRNSPCTCGSGRKYKRCCGR